MSALVILSDTSVIETSGGEVVLDVAFVEAMKLHCQLWPGRVRGVVWQGATQIEHGLRYSPDRLGFDLVVLPAGEPLPELLLDEAGLVYCSADDWRHLHLGEAMRHRIGRLVLSVETTPLERFMQALTQPQTGGRLRAVLAVLRHEVALRHALHNADGLHFRASGAEIGYRWFNREVLVCTASRLRTPMLARPAEKAARAERLRSGAPLRLIYCGRLDQPSGAADLLPLAQRLQARELDFSLEVIGAGPLEARLRDGVASLRLDERVILRAPMAFETALVPHLRRSADLMLVPNRAAAARVQAIEAMGCGVPVLAYSSPAWKRVSRLSGGGWACRRGASAMADRILTLNGDREALVAASKAAVSFARAHTFEAGFMHRMAHLRTIAGLD
ncbi:MAG: glycosyltransferase [Pararhodobacter sp.]